MHEIARCGRSGTPVSRSLEAVTVLLFHFHLHCNLELENPLTERACMERWPWRPMDATVVIEGFSTTHAFATLLPRHDHPTVQTIRQPIHTTSDCGSPMAPLEMPLKEAANLLAKLGAEPWLKAHGKRLGPDITRKQALELRECFELIDTDGLGTISTRDVHLAFTVLGMDMKRSEIDDAVREIMGTKRTMNLAQFMRVMVSQIDMLPVDEYSPSDSGKDPSTEYTLPFALLAQAYRRKKLIEAVMGGDRKLQERMKFRSRKAMVERKALRDLLSGKTPEKDTSVKVVPTEKDERKALVADSRKNHAKPKKQGPEPAIPSYLIANMAPDMSELLLGEKRTEVIKSALDKPVKFKKPTTRSFEVDRPILGPGGEELSPTYLREKLVTFREDMRHKPTMRTQVIRVQALKTFRDFYTKGSMQVKGSPFLYPASRRPTVAGFS